MSAESPRHIRSGGPLTVPSQPPADRSLIDAVSGFINDVKLTSATVDPKDVIQWARFETADINEPTPEGDSDNDISPLLLVLGYGTGVQVWLIPPNGEAQEVLSWRQGTVRVLRILPTPNRGDCFTAKRPLIALCDSASPGPAFCSLSFISIRGGEQVKSIKFKNPILDVLANKRSVVVSFSERFAVFDAGTLEDRMAVTTCYPCPCPLGGTAPINPLALGDRWLAYADKKLNPSKRSSGGCEGEGQTSYTATVLHAAKSLSKGLRGLGESVAHSLAGTRAASQSPSPPHADHHQPGVVTVLDIEGIEEEDGQDAEEQCDPIVAHFVAHSEAVIALKFDASGMVLVTADRRGHDFHVFRINPHPCGPALAAVHHLYVLHRGDTTAKVQDIAISSECRWAAVSTLRGTTHVFALSPYGGAVGVRTHTSPRVVNRLSRFHRSAGLPIHAPAHKPAPMCESGSAGAWFPNPRLPPFPAPAACAPLAQLRPTPNLATHTITRTSAGRQRLSSVSEESSSAPLLARAAWGSSSGRAGSHHSLYLMAASGSLMHLVLHPRAAAGVPKEKISDDSPIELEVEPIAQWPLQRPPAAADLLAPLPPSNPLLQPLECRRCSEMCMSEEERWLAQVEIVTHAGPHRRLWMGPQFVFKTYNCTGSNSSLSEAETVEVEGGVARSNPVNMPGARPMVPVLIDSGSASSLEHSPSDSFRRKSLLAETGRAASVCDVQLREDLAEAMKEDQGHRRAAASRSGGGCPRGVELSVGPSGTVVRAVGGDVPRLADPDDYTRANTDEATFRPVVRASAHLPPQQLPARPLPLTTTIPVQSLTPPPLVPTDVTIPADATLSAFLAADARLQREIDDARNDLAPPEPTLPPRPDPAFRLNRSPTPRLDSDISDDSSSIKVCKSEPEVDRSGIVDCDTLGKVEFDRETEKALVLESAVEVKVKSKRREPSEPKIVTETVKVEPETSIEVKVKSSKRRELSEPKIITETVKVEPETPIEVKVKSSKRREPSEPKIVTESVKVEPETTIEVKTKSSKRREPSEPKIVTETVKVEPETPIEVKVKSSKRREPSESKIVTETVKVEPEIPIEVKVKPSKRREPSVPKVVLETVKVESETSEKEAPIDTKLLLENKRSDSETSKFECEEKKSIKDRKSDLKPARSTKGSSETKKDWIDPKKEGAKTDLKKDFAETKKELSTRKTSTNVVTTSTKDVILEMKTSMNTDISDTIISTKEENIEDKSSDNLDKYSLSDLKLSAKTDLPDVDLPVKEQVPEPKISLKEESPKLKVLTKRGLRERESSPRKEVKEYKSAWKKDSTKLEWPLKSESIESMKSSKKEIEISKSLREEIVEIKTEEQAWDMLLNEPEKQVLSVSPQSAASDKSDDTKTKPKKNRKIKKSQDDTQNKSEDDSFIEIHAIEDKAQQSSGELVSISMPFEEIDSCSSYSSKTKKIRSPKDNIDKKEQTQPKLDDWSLEDIDCAIKLKSCSRKKNDIEILSEYDSKTKSKDPKIEKLDFHKVENADTAVIETTTLKEVSKEKKNKSSTSSQECRKSAEKQILEMDVKDVYVIDSTKDEFPEIQITSSRGSKMRKKSPIYDSDKNSEDIDVIPEKPIKSWSSIAASKSAKKTEEDTDKKTKLKITESKVEDSDIEYEVKNIYKVERKHKARFPEDDEPSSPISLHEELMRLCKRTDIMVAQCDAPSGLNFVDEHHSLLHDLPPLELDFGLDDFRLEVMRDSLLDVNDSEISSPICKINIDSILSSIKESTSAFNLIDLEKVPDKKEKGFSVVENDKITSHEVKVDDDSKSDDKEMEVMEKSSDDDNASPALSADSDKEDKKSTGASNITLPSSKQSSKSKKSRRKKK